jgi:hypothetical protein
VTIVHSSEKSVSRREFARRAAFGAASAALVPLPNLLPIAQDPVQNPSSALKLSAQSQTEADARYQAILQQYGERFSAEQKTDLKRLCAAIQASLDHLRAYTIANGDLPALFLKPLVDRDKKPAPSSNAPAGKQSPAAGKL